MFRLCDQLLAHSWRLEFPYMVCNTGNRHLALRLAAKKITNIVSHPNQMLLAAHLSLLALGLRGSLTSSDAGEIRIVTLYCASGRRLSVTVSLRVSVVWHIGLNAAAPTCD